MDLAKTLDSLNSMLNVTKSVPMTRAQFEAYAADQVNKAKGEMDDGEEEKAKKRLTHLRDVVATIKAEGEHPGGAWSGDNGEKLIPVYEQGVEDSTRKGEMNSSSMQTPPAGNTGTQGSSGGAFANMGDLNGTNPQTPAGTQMLPEGQGTQGAGSIGFSNDGALHKALAGLKKTVESMAAAPVAPAKAAPAPAAPSFGWPMDLAETEEVIGKEALAKRAPESWGKDSDAAPGK